MSSVTGIILCARTYEPGVAKVQEWIESQGFHRLVQFDEALSCGKHPQMEVLGAGYNYFPFLEFKNVLHDLIKFEDRVIVTVQHDNLADLEVWQIEGAFI